MGILEDLSRIEYYTRIYVYTFKFTVERFFHKKKAVIGAAV